jgi:uncharacterized membrane protein YciS (DUF1049 family)
MIIIIGLVILIAAVITGVAGVLANNGSSHALTHGFAVFGYHVTGSTGTLFLYGIVVGALGFFGLSLLLAGARRTSRRGHAARRGLKQSRQETAAVRQSRDDLIDERDTARASAEGTHGNNVGRHPLPADGRWHMPHLTWTRPAAPDAAHPEPAAGQPASDATAPVGDAPAESPRPAASAANGSQP